MRIHNAIQQSSDLVTSHEATRSVFIEMALEKNRKATPFISEAKHIREISRQINNPWDLLKNNALQGAILTACGISDKAVKFFNASDKMEAATNFIRNFLEPAGEAFPDELTYRFLITRGDTLGGMMRNFAGKVGESKFTDYLLAALRVNKIDYYMWIKTKNKYTLHGSNLFEQQHYYDIKALHWVYEEKPYLLIYNTNVPAIEKNIDLSLIAYKPTLSDYDVITDAVNFMTVNPSGILGFGELKGGIDPAGADEHWKTGNSALQRIRDAYGPHKLNPKTFFIAAAIQKAMADEIYKQYQKEILSNAANLTSEKQMVSLVEWLIKL